MLLGIDGLLPRFGIANNSPVSDAIRAAATRHVDFVGIGDSNQLLGGFGWDHGFQYALAQTYPMYATGLISAMENNGSGAAAGYNYGYSNGNDFAYVGAPSELSQHLNTNDTQYPYPHRYAYGDDAATFAGTFTGLAVSATGALDVNANLRFRLHYGTFPSGTATATHQVRRSDSPYTTLATATRNPVTGSYGMTYVDLDVAAAARNYPIAAYWAQVGTTTQGPYFYTYSHCINQDATAGFAYSTLNGHGGASFRTILLEMQAAGTPHFTHFFSILRDRQSDSAKKIVITINGGLNDRNEASASVGPSPVADGDSPEAYADNVRGLIALIEGVWTANAWPLSELSFLIIPSHPISTPDDAELLTYRMAALNVAMEDVTRRQMINLADLTTYTEMLANTWYAVGPDTSHLRQAGYETLATRTLGSLT